MDINLNTPHPPDQPIIIENPKKSLRQYFGSPLVVMTLVILVLSAGTTSYLFFAHANSNQSLPHFPSVAPSHPSESPTPVSQVTQIPTLTQAPTTPSPTLMPTAYWNTYRSLRYGYSIKYPVNWTVQTVTNPDPKILNYVVFNPETATTSARSISVTVTTRTYQEQLAIGGNKGTPVSVAKINGTKQDLQDSDANKSESIVLPLKNYVVILHTKSSYQAVFDDMVGTFTFL